MGRLALLRPQIKSKAVHFRSRPKATSVLVIEPIKCEKWSQPFERDFGLFQNTLGLFTKIIFCSYKSALLEAWQKRKRLTRVFQLKRRRWRKDQTQLKRIKPKMSWRRDLTKTSGWRWRIEINVFNIIYLSVVVALLLSFYKPRLTDKIRAKIINELVLFSSV